MASTAGELLELEAQIREGLGRMPDHPGLLAALGGVRLQAGDAEEGMALLEQAARLAPDDPRILGDYGGALTGAKRLDEAESVLRMAMAIAGPDDNLRFNLARCHQLQGRPAEGLAVLAAVGQPGGDVCKLRGDLAKAMGDWRGAMAAYMQAIELDPDNAAYLNDLGVMLEMHGDPAEHCRLWEELAARAGAHGVVHFFLGNARRAEGQYEAAAAAYRQAVALEPEMAEAHNNLALVLAKLGQEEEAMAAFRRAAAVNPDLVAPQSNLGALMSRDNVLDEAEAILARAVAIDPDCLDARVNYGAVLMRQRRFSEAEREFRRVLAQCPGQASAELNLGLLKLTEGALDEGWPYYESRWKMPQLAEKRPQLDSPPWGGEPLDGKTLLVFSEQGFGDNLQFVRYLPELRRRFPSVSLIYYSLHALTDLIAQSPVAAGCQVLAWGQPIPTHDVHCPVLSLPWRCATALASIPAAIPYLQAPPERVAHWRERLAGLAGRRVGLVWSTSETFIYRSAKTVALRRLLPLFALPGIAWVNLQFGKEAGELAENGLAGQVFDAMGEVRDFADTAAIIANLDLVISVDTAVAHLAGALGRPVWMLDRFDTDWRWLPPREDSPWYPTLRIFRQGAMGAWDGVVDRAADALREFTKT